PGQLYDAHSALHYNYFRDYDPETGRYVESDPIGLRGGVNTYAYVGSNPVGLVDPNGLSPTVGAGAAGGFVVGGPPGAVVGGLIGLGLGALGANAAWDAYQNSISETETQKCSCLDATPENIRMVAQRSTYMTIQGVVSAPAVQAYVDMVRAGSTAIPPIKIDGNIIVDGNHRHIVELLCNIPVPTVPGAAAPSKIPLAIPVSQIRVSTTDWGNR
ncbi:RHS repeat-associated core domain-containing protein, partial [Pseudomonas indica]|uniref:RHS repeat-associated core domain-containing protein n=1 Tax=Pseudomonas indica TaxID=137658 RepID=UPI003FD48F56